MTATLISSPVSAKDMRSAVLDAIETHPVMTQAGADRDIGKFNKKATTSDYYPTVSMSISGGRFYADTTTTRGLTVDRGAGYSGLLEMTTSVTQPIVNMPTIYKIDSAEMRKEAAKFKYMSAEDQVALQAGTAYLNTLRTKEVLRLVRQYYAEAVDYRQRIDLLVEKGAASNIEKQQIANLETAVQKFATQSEAEFEAAKAEYKAIIGAEPDHLSEPEMVFEKATITDKEAVVSQALDIHPALEELRLQEDAARIDVDSKFSEYYPTLDAEVSYLKRDQEDIVGGESTDARGLVKLSWSFATGGRVGHEVDQAEATAIKTRAQFLDKRRTLEQSIRSALAEYEASHRLQEHASKRLKDTQSLYKSEKQSFESGTLELIKLAGTSNTAFQSRVEEANARYVHKMSYLNLLSTIGQTPHFFKGNKAILGVYLKESLQPAKTKKVKKTDKTVTPKNTKTSKAVPKPSLKPEMQNDAS